MATADAIAALQTQFPDIDFRPEPLMKRSADDVSDQIAVRVVPERLLEVMAFLRDDSRTAFNFLSDVTAVDYLNFPEAEDRFAVIYNLVSFEYNHRLWVKVYVNDPNPEVPSVTALWPGANWREREQFDMFGITFTSHPDLRRILCAEFFDDHCLRKDYPLTGRGERENFQRLSRESA